MTGGLLLVLAAGLLVGGAELFVDNAAGAGRRLGLTGLAVGLLLAGAEPEELVTAAIASGRGHPGLAIGDAIGANVTMLTVCLGLAALIRPLPVGHRVRSYAVLSTVAGLLALAALADGRVGRAEGAALLLGYATLVAVIWWRERQPPALGEVAELSETGEPDDGGGGRRPASGLLLALAGVALMAVGGDAAVEGASRVVSALHAEDTAVGLTILALATTVELFALLGSAIRRGVSELAVAGVVGSAAYNATATIGAAALVRPLRTDAGLAPAMLAAALPAVLLIITMRGRLPRWGGMLLVAGYAAFVAVVLS